MHNSHPVSTDSGKTVCRQRRRMRTKHSNESAAKITINNTIQLFSKTTIIILGIIANHNNSFRVPFDKIASVYFI